MLVLLSLGLLKAATFTENVFPILTWCWLLFVGYAHVGNISWNTQFNPSYPGLFWSGESLAGGQFCPHPIVSDRNRLLTWNLVQSYIVLLHIACWEKKSEIFHFHVMRGHWISQQFGQFSRKTKKMGVLVKLRLSKFEKLIFSSLCSFC